MSRRNVHVKAAIGPENDRLAGEGAVEAAMVRDLQWGVRRHDLCVHLGMVVDHQLISAKVVDDQPVRVSSVDVEGGMVPGRCTILQVEPEARAGLKDDLGVGAEGEAVFAKDDHLATDLDVAAQGEPVAVDVVADGGGADIGDVALVRQGAYRGRYAHAGDRRADIEDRGRANIAPAIGPHGGIPGIECSQRRPRGGDRHGDGARGRGRVEVRRDGSRC